MSAHRVDRVRIPPGKPFPLSPGFERIIHVRDDGGDDMYLYILVDVDAARHAAKTSTTRTDRYLFR